MQSPLTSSPRSFTAHGFDMNGPCADLVVAGMCAVTGGTVLDRILEIASFTEAQAASVAADVLNALHYLHNIGITHRQGVPQGLPRCKPFSCLASPPG